MRLQATFTLRRHSLRSVRHARLLATRPTLTLGIRREDPSRIWERRVPLTPKAVKSLIADDGVRVLLQPCARRVFPTDEYLKVGAEVDDSLHEANVIIGIKETPLNELLTDSVNGRPRTQIMFSHTAKGQSYNMPLLSRFAQSDARLIDYELLTNEHGKRAVAFGWYAGAAGVPEAFGALAHDHLQLGVSSPFLLLPRPYNHRGLDDLRQSLRDVGAIISQHGTPKETGPYIVALTGNGNVSQGALSLLKELPIKQVRVKDLEKLATSPDTPRNVIYLVHVQPEDYLIDIRGVPYSRATYYSHPQLFNSLFYQRVAPYISMLINGTGWKPGFPRLMNNLQLAMAQEAAQRVGKARFRTIADISCDIEGGLEFVSRPATIDDPFFTARPVDHPSHLPGIQVMSVDILPSEIPLDSSKHFSSKLVPYLRSLIRSESGRDLSREDMSNLDVLNRGTIIQGGKLREPHAWLASQLNSPSTTQSVSVLTTEDISNGSAVHQGKKQRVVVLGSGMVAKPAVDHIASRKDIELIVASADIREGAALVASHENASAVKLDAQDPEALESLVRHSDVVISLLPATMHAAVAKHCINHGKHLVTASYISPEMKALHEQATKADVLLLNEIGLDPGIDHCSAVDLCQRIRDQGRDIVSFVSLCGGLPAPEDSNVPLAYKFSWSPRGVLTAALNGAKFRLGGEEFAVQPGKLLDTVFHDIPLVPGLALDCLPNRDSMSYSSIYDLNPSRLETMFRGTLRYKGFAALMRGFISAGLLDMNNAINLNTSGGWQSLLARSLSLVHNSPVKNNQASLTSALSALMDDADVLNVLEAAEWLSITPKFSTFESSPGNPDQPSSAFATPLVPPQPISVIDLFARLLSHKLRYLPGESDSVILSHEIISRPISASQSVSGSDQDLIHTSTLLLRQPSPTNTAMAVTVGLPVALAALRVLDGHVTSRGVVGPTAERQIYGPILEEMSELGLVFKEETKQRRPGSGLAGNMIDTGLKVEYTKPMNRRLYA